MHNGIHTHILVYNMNFSTQLSYQGIFNKGDEESWKTTCHLDVLTDCSVTAVIDGSLVSIAEEGLGGWGCSQTLPLWLCEWQNHGSPSTVQINMRESSTCFSLQNILFSVLAKSIALGVWWTSVWLQVLPLWSCVIPGKLADLSVPQFLPVPNGSKGVLASWDYLRVLWDTVHTERGTCKLLINCVLIILLLGKISGTPVNRGGSYFWNSGLLSEHGLKGNGLVSKSLYNIFLIRDKIVPEQ